MSNEAKNFSFRIGGLIGLSISIVVAATFLGLLSRVTWLAFSWGWDLFGL
jgi:hypothetical protein